MDFREALEAFGFGEREERTSSGGNVRMFVATPNRYMTYTIYAHGDGTAIFSWEFAIADYLATKGLQVGSDEALNQFMYPRSDVRGPQDAAWLSSAIEQTEGMLASVRFDQPET